MSDCILESAARIAAVSMPNCPFAFFGRIATIPSATTAPLSSVGRYHFCAWRNIGSDWLAGLSLFGTEIGLRRQKNDLRCLSGFFFGSIIKCSLSCPQGSSDQTVNSACGGCSALYEHVVVGNTARF